MIDILYWSMVAAFASHELDAMRRHEWRILPLTNFLPDEIGARVFLWAHLPLFFLIFWFSKDGGNSVFAAGLSSFAIVHVGLHWLFRSHPKNEFNTFGSWVLIALVGILGALHLIAYVLVR